jgi:hypothetical protein
LDNILACEGEPLNKIKLETFKIKEKRLKKLNSKRFKKKSFALLPEITEKLLDWNCIPHLKKLLRKIKD